MKKVFLVGFMILTSACVTASTLKNSKVKNTEERAVIESLSKLEQAYGNLDVTWAERVDGVTARYTPNASIQIGTKEDPWEGVIVNGREEFRKITITRTYFDKYKCEFKYYAPDILEVQGNKARATYKYEIIQTVPFKTSSGNDWYMKEIGIYRVELSKTDGGWLVSKSRWEILENNSPRFQEYKRKKK